jgi:hypothetical protein
LPTFCFRLKSVFYPEIFILGKKMKTPAKLFSLAQEVFCSRFKTYREANTFLRTIGITLAFREDFLEGFDFFSSTRQQFCAILDHLCPDISTQNEEEYQEYELLKMYIYVKLADSFFQETDEDGARGCSWRRFRPFFDTVPFKDSLQHWSPDFYCWHRDETALETLTGPTRSSARKRREIRDKREKIIFDFNLQFAPGSQLKLFDRPQDFNQVAFRWLEELFADCRCQHCSCPCCKFRHCTCLEKFCYRVHRQYGDCAWYEHFLGYAFVLFTSDYYNKYS